MTMRRIALLVAGFVVFFLGNKLWDKVFFSQRHHHVGSPSHPSSQIGLLTFNSPKDEFNLRTT